MLRTFFLFLSLTIGITPQIIANTNANEYKFEGFLNHDRFYILPLFLTHDPNICVLSKNPDIVMQCEKLWPLGKVQFGGTLSSRDCESYDFLWLDYEVSGGEIYKRIRHLLGPTKVIYTTTFLTKNGPNFGVLRKALNHHGYTMLSHWYLENQHGNAIFLRDDIFEVVMNGFNYTPGKFSSPINYDHHCDISQFFRKTGEKPKNHKIDQIDFIYMINLDERPEKFLKATQELTPHGIEPYRFSAVNGWKLPAEVINQLGVKFFENLPQERFFSTIYKEIDGKVFPSNEFVEKNEATYFCLGMSRGAIGIVLSHLSVLQDALDSGYETIWVMEDDVEVLENPLQLSELIIKLDSQIPNWDILFTDLDTKNGQGQRIPSRSIAARPNIDIEPLAFFLEKFQPINQDFSQIGMRYGAYSMILRRSGIIKILNYFKKNGVFLPYDMDYWLIPDLKMYSVNRDIISTMPDALTDNLKPGYKSGI